MISIKEFECLFFLMKNKPSKDYIKSNQIIINQLLLNKYIKNDYTLSEHGIEILDEYKVDNAIIFAAGMSTRFVPVSYEIPKGLTVVKGDVMIERQISQLKEAGIDEIIVVIGHMLEKFIYLKEKYGVKLVVNNEYKYKNTHSSLYVARDYLKNTYICCSDNYFPQNIFKSHEYRSIYSTLYMPGIHRGERGVFVNDNGLIIATQRPAKDQWVMNGYAYFNNEFSSKFKPILEDYYGKPGTDQLYWEQIYAEHVDELHLYEKRYKDDEVLEFDSVAELEKFDKNYIVNNDLQLVRNICTTLQCCPSELKDIKPIEKGLTNRSFSFKCKDMKYIYRNPGKQSTGLVDRKSEKKALEIVKKLDVDDSYIYIDENEGWKISHFIDETESFDFNNINHLKMLCDILRKMHQSKSKIGVKCDYFEKTKDLLKIIYILDSDTYNDVKKLYNEIKEVDLELKNDNWDIQLSHNDIYEDNLMISNDKLYLIDWEYAGDADISYDICKLFVKNNCPTDKIDKYLELYFNRKPTYDEHKHIVGCTAVSYYYWFIWAVYMIKKGNNYQNYMLAYYDIAVKYLNAYKKLK